MEEVPRRTAGQSVLLVLAAVCAAFVLFFNFCMINIIGGEIMVMFRSPLQLGEGGNIVDVVESLLVIMIPIVLGVFVFLFSDKKPILLGLPLALNIFRFLVKTGYLCLYESRLTLTDTWQDLLIYTILLIVFVLTVMKKVPTGWWFAGICALLIVMEMLKLFIPVAVSDLESSLSIYLSNYLSAMLFFLGYGILGLMIDQKVGADYKDESGKEEV